jgi:hypothetical protein
MHVGQKNTYKNAVLRYYRKRIPPPPHTHRPIAPSIQKIFKKNIHRSKIELETEIYKNKNEEIYLENRYVFWFLVKLKLKSFKSFSFKGDFVKIKMIIPEKRNE